MLNARGSYTKAIDHFDKALEAYPRNGLVW